MSCVGLPGVDAVGATATGATVVIWVTAGLLRPAVFTATTLMGYVRPSASPVMVQDVALVVQVEDPAITMYCRSLPPPLLAGLTQDTAADPPEAVAFTSRGALAGFTNIPATPTGEEALAPAEFLAFTVNAYDLPPGSPVIVHDRAPVVEQLLPPGDALTVYPVIGLPPSFAGAVQLTLAVPGLEYLADTASGGSGAVTGIVTGLDVAAALVPAAFDAVTFTVTGTPRGTFSNLHANTVASHVDDAGVVDTRYVNTSAPPQSDGCAHDTSTALPTGVATTDEGGWGTEQHGDAVNAV
jgi:hypothetical protein